MSGFRIYNDHDFYKLGLDQTCTKLPPGSYIFTPQKSVECLIINILMFWDVLFFATFLYYKQYIFYLIILIFWDVLYCNCSILQTIYIYLLHLTCGGISILHQYGLDTSEFTYNPSESNRLQQASAQPAEERSRCTIM